MKEWLNRGELMLHQDSPHSTFQFFFWGNFHKILVAGFMHNHQMQHNWQLHYLQTLLTEYQPRPNISNIDLNCAFPDSDLVDRVQFYFGGTHGFQVKKDGTPCSLNEVSFENTFTVKTPPIGPLLVNEWENGDGSGVEQICLH